MTRHILRGAGTAVLLLAVILVGCQTAQPFAPTESAIQVETSGFSPSNLTGHNTIQVSMLYGNPEALKSWKVEIVRSGQPVKAWTGTAEFLPSIVNWNGRNDGENMAPEGVYAARLTIDYASKYQPSTVESRSFILDISDPTGTVALDPPQFTPRGPNGVTGPMTITINARSALAHMDSWTLDVFDASGGLVNSWSGEWPNASVSWNGATMNGGVVIPSSQYTAVATVIDEYGNTGLITSDITVAALPVPATPAPIPRDPAIVALTSGFSPNGDRIVDTLMLDLSYGKQTTPITSWQVMISGTSEGFEKTWTGGTAGMPGRLQWDGKTDRGLLAPEGTYTATLSIRNENTANIHTAKSSTFVLDVTPPTGTLTLSTGLFSPIESADKISLILDASSKVAKIDNWTMEIREPGGKLFRTFAAKWPANIAVWNGKSSRGEMVESGEEYSVVAKVRDQYGLTGFLRVNVPIDILVEKTATGYRILASRIFFTPFSADYTNVDGGLAAQNVARLDMLAEKLKKFPGYKIRVVGHAVMVNWDNAAAGKREQANVLIPLSKARANAVQNGLVSRGLEQSRFTVEGVGAADQLVPDSNLGDRWRNRRVAFFLDN